MTPPRLLVAGVGNIFHGDDAFGVELVRRLACLPQVDGVRVADFGIRGRDLAYAILDGYDPVVLLDTTSRGGAPGTLYVLELDLAKYDEAAISQGHGLNPMEVFRLVKAMGGTLPRAFLVGCEPAAIDLGEEGEMGLSPAVHWAVEEAIPMVQTLVKDLMVEARSATHA